MIIFGNICIDRICRVPYLPKAGGYVEMDSQIEVLGGEAANTAAALAGWGVSFQVISNDLGMSDRGTEILNFLKKYDLADVTTPIADVQNSISPICTILVTLDGSRTMFGIGFKSPCEFVGKLPIKGEKNEWFTVDSNSPAIVKQAIALAKIERMRIYLMDIVPDELPPNTVGDQDFWQGSTDQFGVLGNIQRNVDWLRDFILKYKCHAILSDGPNGFIYGSPTEKARAYPPFTAPNVIDMTGAGDIFRAGMLYGLSQRLTISDSLAFASAVGSLSVGKLGGAGAAPSIEEVQRFQALHPEVLRQYA